MRGYCYIGVKKMEELNLGRDEILARAFDNSYMVLTGEEGINGAEVFEIEGGQIALFIYDPEEGPDFEDVVLMMLYYEQQEMYERCAVLKRMAIEMKKK